MSDDIVYLIKPSPPTDYLVPLAQKLSSDGYNLSYIDKDVLLLTEMKRMLLEKGATSIVSTQLLLEEVLPDSTPRDAVLDVLIYKLNRCTPTSSMLIIDPYIYPSAPDPDYVNHFVHIFRECIEKCGTFEIATLTNRNSSLENQIDTAMRQLKPSLVINKKYTNIFHDRFWIADESKGLFVGTSLNGIGRRYSVIDYLSETDANDIVQRYKALA